MDINVIKDMLMVVKDMVTMVKDRMMVVKDMTMMEDLPAGAGHYLDLWSHQLRRNVAPLAIDTNPQNSTVQKNTTYLKKT